MSEVTDRDRELAAYWTERGDLRAWIAGIIAATRRAEIERCAAIVQKAADTWWVDFSPDAGDLRAMVQEIRNG